MKALHKHSTEHRRMPAPDQTFDLNLNTDLSELERMDAWVHHVAERLQLCENVVHALHLCLIEVVTNIIAYGGDTSDRGIGLSIQGLKDAVIARVSDNGLPFDPLTYVLPPKPTRLDDGGIGGYGIRIIREFATALDYQREDRQNSLTLTFER